MVGGWTQPAFFHQAACWNDQAVAWLLCITVARLDVCSPCFPSDEHTYSNQSVDSLIKAIIIQEEIK